MRSSSAVSNTKELILVVEDEATFRVVISEFLGECGYDITFVASCAEAREAIRGNSYACVVTDLGLPDGNGLSLLPEIAAVSPLSVPIVLTADSRSDVIVEALRNGAFDYLVKPIEIVAMQTAVKRALEHHKALREREELLALLSEERELLARRVEEATAGIRQNAVRCERANARLSSLLRLTRASSRYYTDEQLFRVAAEEISKHVPLACVALCSWPSSDFVAAVRETDGTVSVIHAAGRPSTIPASAQSIESSLTNSVASQTNVDTSQLKAWVYPEEQWGRTMCAVGFYLDSGQELADGHAEFLNACASIISMEWHEAQLFFHATAQGSLGSVAMELFKSFVQSMTAIQTASDVIGETALSDEGRQALQIIRDDVEKLGGRIQEFRRLAAPQKGSLTTIRLSECIQRALDVLAQSLRNRNLNFVKQYESECECVVLNVEMLIRTLVDLLASVAHLVEPGGNIELRLAERSAEEVALELRFVQKQHERVGDHPGENRATVMDIESTPAISLARHVIGNCAGHLHVEYADEGRRVFRIVLPKNAMMCVETMQDETSQREAFASLNGS